MLRAQKLVIFFMMDNDSSDAKEPKRNAGDDNLHTKVFIPESIQRIILEYTFEYLSQIVGTPIILETLQYYDRILKIPKEVYSSVLSSESYLLCNIDIVKWLLSKREFNTDEIVDLFHKYCSIDHLEGAKLIKTQFNLEKDQCLKYEHTEYHYYRVYYRFECYSITNWMEKEFKLPNKEIRHLT